MTRVGRAYLLSVIACGLTAVLTSLFDAQRNPLPFQWYLLAALTFISGSATVNLPATAASISISETFVFASVLLFGPSAGTITVALDGLVISFWMAKRRPEWYRALFNMAAPAISIWVAAHILFVLTGAKPLFNSHPSINELLFPLVVFAITYFGFNSWLIAFAIGLEGHISPYKVWRKNFLWVSLNYFCGASVALLLVAYSNNVDITFIGVIVPLLLVLYLTFKTSMGRVQDATSHVQQLNRLYLSTIETLAMAIDAKDQITHGHIRRVQQYAVRLAQELGISDEGLLKALEAAALLHDMGKLAVPEYILNKPGKLSPIEFERMKQHATVGADILAAIEFPYPVVPIVRHHHENWDGTGYPAGLSGTDIPIGARILSVVDCFDALVSDRPYRPRLSDEAALAILIERRGTMYDPWVVDTFLQVHPRITPASIVIGSPASVLNEIATTSQIPPAAESSVEQHTLSARELSSLMDFAVSLSREGSFPSALDALVKYLLLCLPPAALCVFFAYDPASGDLPIRIAAGTAAHAIRNLRVGLGERLSGWVGANRQTILNSDAILDFGNVEAFVSAGLRTCLSTPVVFGDVLVGVVSLYSTQAKGFTQSQARFVELIAAQAGKSFERWLDCESVRHPKAAIAKRR